MNPNDHNLPCDHLQPVLSGLVPSRSLTDAELNHVDSCDRCSALYTDLLITQALETQPEIEIPTNFAARVASSAPPRPMLVRVRGTYGRRIAIACIVLLSCALLAISLYAHSTSPVIFGIEIMLTIELAAITVWLGFRRTTN